MLIGAVYRMVAALLFMKQLSLTLDEQAHSVGRNESQKLHSIKDIFRAPKNIRLGGHYVSLGGRVFYAIKYVVTGMTSTGLPIVELQIREGRESFVYRYISIDSFSRAIEAGKLVLVV